MKARPFLAVVLALGLLLLSLGAGAWWLVWQRSPLQLQHRAMNLPQAARFVPRQAPLSLHLLSDGEEALAYARAVAPSGRRQEAAAALQRLRDGAFAAAGLDYTNELASWLGPGISLAVLDLPALGPEREGRPGQGPGDAEPANWLLALHSRDGEGARRFLQRFWQSRSLAGSDLQISSYRGMGLISGRGAPLGQEPVPLATALVSDDLLLIASGRGVLEQALDVSQIDELNQGADPELRRRIEALGPGVGLVVARGDGLRSALGGGPEAGPGTLLVAALQPEGAGLRLHALLQRPGQTPPAPAGSETGVSADRPADPGQDLLQQAPQASERLALLQDPASLRQDPWLRPLVDLAALPTAGGPLPPLLLDAARGPLLAAQAPMGWLMATPAGQPSPSSLETPLAAEGLIPAPLEVAGQAVSVWTRLKAAPSSRSGRGSERRQDQLQAPLEGWRSDRGDLALWGRSLALLQQVNGGGGDSGLARQIERQGQAQASLQWAMASDPARSLLRGWLPWRRLALLAGGTLDGPVQGLTLSAAPGEDGLRIEARLDLGRGA